MLLVTKAQRRDAGYSAFVDRVVRHMKLHYWADVGHLPPEVLWRRVSHCVEKGRERGFTYERSLAIFTANMMRIDPKFHEQKNIAALLDDADRPEEERLEGLVKEISPDDWAEAGEMCADKQDYWWSVDRQMADPATRSKP
ncbi:hypothetical protein [Polyangium sp. y55x31]|uniref:hypothetical protein n=1 Tax=Polyangium sp. y55x31 TaxID=3042688 RepID=UPI002482BD90|nr:hypothetical protein [Polyangium sp. y55x31]MDI1480058.1 hypothetical protein [Polyangium sp. y55x31]